MSRRKEPEPLYQPGSLVVLRSGGPTMTVEDVDYAHECRCAWLGRGAKLHRARFPEAALMPAPVPRPGPIRPN